MKCLNTYETETSNLQKEKNSATKWYIYILEVAKSRYKYNTLH